MFWFVISFADPNPEHCKAVILGPVYSTVPSIDIKSFICP